MFDFGIMPSLSKCAPFPRKVKQITSTPLLEGHFLVVALADDGTLWQGCLMYQGKGKVPLYVWEWDEIPQLPQPQA